MPLRSGVGLPGPFYYSARVFPRRRTRPVRRSEPVTSEAVTFGLFLIALPVAVVAPVMLLGPFGLLVWAGLIWWLARRVLRRRRDEEAEIAAYVAAGPAESKPDAPDGWRTYQASLLD